ncbi:hypothetical protein [uncultured Prevotella sp.]|mgnify:CR=1 FL=1|uniref:hypothetical protein n=1 Tax=uncultured Prevotella sp. TaxID=159272 RepID=UPI0026765D0E|nr:hypothetical protein [uncultured Prevotella sp.]
MKTLIIILSMLFEINNLDTVKVTNNNVQLIFDIKTLGKVNNGDIDTGIHRTMPNIPYVIQYEHILFISNLTFSSLRLLDTNDNIIYETPLEGNEKEVQLPSNIKGNFELQIIIGNICYYTNIQL